LLVSPFAGRPYRASTETADKHKAQDIEARERSRILDGRHGIRWQPDVTFRDFAKRAHGQKRPAKPVKPATVNRELDVLKSILSKAVEWGKLLESPARIVKRLRVDNRRTRILSDDEQRRLLAECPKKLRALVMLALITGARIGELLALRWEEADDGFLTFLDTKNGKMRRIPIGPSIAAVLAALPKVHPWVHSGHPFSFLCKALSTLA